MQVKKQQLELDVEQQTGSKLRKEYSKPVYCHPAYLIYMQSMCVCVSDSATLWTVANQASLFMEFSRSEYQSGLPGPPPEDLPHPGIEPVLPVSPALVDEFFATWEAHPCHDYSLRSINKCPAIGILCFLSYVQRKFYRLFLLTCSWSLPPNLNRCLSWYLPKKSLSLMQEVMCCQGQSGSLLTNRGIEAML